MNKIVCIALVSITTLSLYSQNAIPKITRNNIQINKNDNRVDISFDVLDPDNEDLDIQCRIYNLTVDKKYEEIIPQKLDGDVGFPVKQGINKQISVYFDLAVNQSNLIIVLTAIDKEPIDINAILSQVDPVNLENNLRQIQGKRNSSDQVHYDASRSYITDQSVKYIPIKTLSYKYNQTNCINFEATKLGHEQPSNIIIMDAHYDSVPISPGADDNGSGVVGVMEAIRILSEYAFKKSVRFLFFDLEELGLVGSSIYTSYQLDKRDSIKAVLNFEMIGFYSDQPNSQSFPSGFNLLFPDAYNTVAANNNRGDFITNVGCTGSSALKTAFQTNASTYVPDLKVISLEVFGTGTIAPDLRRSDHAVFWDKNIPAVMITDGANFRNKNYHTAKDSVSYLNFNFMANVTKATIATMIDLAGIEHGSSTEIQLDLSTLTTNLNRNSFYATADHNDILIKSKANHQNIQIDLIDINGNSVCHEKMNLLSDTISRLKCSELEPGLYFLSIHYPNGKETQKILIHGF
jgi:hypothetical protein